MNRIARWSVTPAASALLVLFAGCVLGPDVTKLAPAQTGQGVEVRVAPSAAPDGPGYGPLTAELLAVQDRGLLIRTSLITFVAYQRIAESEVKDLNRLSFGGGRPPTPEQQRELRLLSRYPQGVSDDLLRRLLDAYDQDALHTIQ